MGFNQAQKRAVLHREGPCLVLAGPGSGKTLTIVNRIRRLIEECKVRPEEILVITFTKYAAAEMKARLLKLCGGKKLPVTMGTFHGIYYGILKWAYRFGPENLLSEEEKYRLIRHIASHVFPGIRVIIEHPGGVPAAAPKARPLPHGQALARSKPGLVHS